MRSWRVSLVAALALVAVAPASAAANDPGSAAPPAGTSLQREVYGFFRPSDRDYMLRVADLTRLSTVAFFAIDARADGSLARSRSDGSPTPSWASWTSSWMDQVIAKAHAAGTDVVLTVKRFSWNDAERARSVRLLTDPDALTRLADAIAQAVVDRGVDGVNLDFEPIPAEGQRSFVTFVRQVRSALDERDPSLSLVVDATGHIARYDVAGLTAPGAADAIFVMGYPFHGPWSERAGATSPLSGLSYDLTDAVDAYLRRTAPDKLILGLPLFGYEWSTETPGLHARTLPKRPQNGYPAERRLTTAEARESLHGRRWDHRQLVPWTRWQTRMCSTCPSVWRQLYYEDMESLGLKFDLASERGLRGVGFWALGYEGDRPELYDLIGEHFARAAIGTGPGLGSVR